MNNFIKESGMVKITLDLYEKVKNFVFYRYCLKVKMFLVDNRNKINDVEYALIKKIVDDIIVNSFYENYYLELSEYNLLINADVVKTINTSANSKHRYIASSNRHIINIILPSPEVFFVDVLNRNLFIIERTIKHELIHYELDKITHSANEFNYFNSDEDEDEDSKKIIAKHWVGIYNISYAYSDNYWKDSWFASLKLKNKKKWERACDLFFKKIGINNLKKEAGLLSIPKNLYDDIYQYAKNCYLTIIEYNINNDLINNIKENDKIEIKNYIKQNLKLKEKADELDAYGFKFEKIFYFKKYILMVKCASSRNHLSAFIYPEKKSMTSQIVICLHPGVMQATTFLKAIKLDLEDLKDTVRHELQHFVQKVIMKNKSLDDFGGLPPKSMRNPEAKYDSDQDLFDPKVYFLQDEEFYPQLTNSISLFNSKFGTLPLKEKYMAAKYWVGENVDTTYIKKKIGKPSKFFLQLRNDNLEKWKKAVKEFYKSISYSNNKITFNELL